MRRRRLVPLATALVALILAAGGFAGGAEIQKHHAGSTSAGASTRGPGGGGATGAPGGTAAATATTGTVKRTAGGTLYVTDANGKTIKIKTTKDSTVTRDAKAAAGAVHPGDSVVITGTTASDGTVTASAVTATG